MKKNFFLWGGRSKSSKKKKIISYLGILVLMLITALFCAGRFLILTQTPNHANVIIVLSGGQGRVEKAVQLYKDGYSLYLMLTNSKESASSSGDMLETALTQGVPLSAIIIENSADSTLQNAEFTLPIMKEHNFKSAIVVSSDFHMRRVKLLFDRVYKKSDIELTYIGSASGYNAKRWWSDRKSRETTFNEYVKMIGNTFGYNGPEAKSILDQIKNWFR